MIFLALIIPLLAFSFDPNELPSRCIETTNQTPMKSRVYPPNGGRSPYEASLSGDEIVRRSGLKEQLLLAQKAYTDLGGSSLKEALRDCANHEITYSTESKAEHTKRVDACRGNRMSASKNAKRLSFFACEGLDCPEAVEKAMEIMDVCELVSKGAGSGASTSLPHLLEFLGNKEKYRRPVCHLALTVLERAEKAQTTPSSWSGDLWKDTLNSIHMTSKLNEKQMKDMAIEILGLIGSRGPSMAPFYDLGGKENIEVFTSLAIISSASSYLDLQSRNSHKIYSLPVEIKSHCDYSRPYHFWLSAYLAHELNHRGIDAKNSFLAIHTTGKLYEMYAAVLTNSDSRDFSTEKVDQDLLFETQKDLVYNSAGALWGVGQSIQQNNLVIIDVDQALIQIMEQSNKDPSSGISVVWGNVVSIAGQLAGSLPTNPAKWQARVAPDAHVPQMLKTLKEFK